MPKPINIRRVSWADQQQALQQIRQKVFVEEQAVAENLEWDEFDASYQHLLAATGSDPVEVAGCCRISPQGKIGRVAVLPQYRGLNLGAELMAEALNYCKELDLNPSLDAQIQATDFYRNLGFIATGQPFDDADIPHIHMVMGSMPDDLTQQDKVIRTESQIQNSGYWRLFNQNISRQLDICCEDLTHPLLNDTEFTQSLSKFLRSNRHAHLRLLMGRAIPQISDHPLIKLHQRLSSKISIKVLDDDCPNLMLCDKTRWFKTEGHQSVLNFNDRAGTKQKQDDFECLWRQGKTSIETRRLHL